MYRMEKYMKRSDLQHMRNSRQKRDVRYRTSRKNMFNEVSCLHIFPIIHVIQFLICIVAFFLMLVYQNVNSNKEVFNFLSLLQNYLNQSVDLQFMKWSGTLKDILIIRK